MSATYVYRPSCDLSAHERAKQDRADLTRDIFFALIAKTESHEADARRNMAYEAKQLAADLLAEEPAASEP